MRRYLCLALLSLYFIVSSGCTPDHSSGGTVFLRVTRDFGREELFASKVEVSPGETALQALQQHLEVGTRYGGRFITSIEGIASSTGGSYPEDWFFYANGITAAVGGADYYPRDGDVIWWDYHCWGDMYFTPAATGSFPQPFLNGYRGDYPGTVILATDTSKDLANAMKDYFMEQGIKKIQVDNYHEEELYSPGGITMAIALWDELKDCSYWIGLQENRQRAGWFAELSTEGFSALDLTGERRETFRENTGAVLVTGSGLGDSRPIWLVTALDRASLERTVNLLVEDSHRLAGTFGVIKSGDKLVKLPLESDDNGRLH